MNYCNLIQTMNSRYSRKINKYCESLFRYLNLNHFWYCKIDSFGQYYFLGSHTAWCEFFASHKLYLKYPYLRDPALLQHGVYLLKHKNVEDIQLEEILNSCSTQFDMKVCLSIINKVEDGVEEFGFTSKDSHSLQMSTLITEIPLLRFFIKKMKKEHTKMFSELSEISVNLKELLGPVFTKRASNHVNNEQKRILLQDMGYQFNLSDREIEVTKLVLEGHPAWKIGNKLGIAKRTAEHHLERIKNKTHCNSKEELIQKARELDELGALM